MINILHSQENGLSSNTEKSFCFYANMIHAWTCRGNVKSDRWFIDKWKMTLNTKWCKDIAEAGWSRAQVLHPTKTPESGWARTVESFLTLLRVLTRCRSWHRAHDEIAEQGVRLDPEKRDSTLTPCLQSNIPLQEFPTRKTSGVFRFW